MKEYKTKISQKPIKAKADWKEIKIKTKKCGNCKSDNTICVYEYTSGCIIGWTIEEELYCKDCKYYTLYSAEYEA